MTISSPSRRFGSIIAAVGIVVGVAVGVIVGRSTSTQQVATQASRPVVKLASLDAPHGPSRMNGVLPVGYTDDLAGALSLASIAAETLVDYVQIRRTISPPEWIGGYTSGSLSAASLQKILDWDPQRYRLPTSTKPTSLAPQRRASSVSEIVPVGYKLIGFTPAAAHLQVWLNGVGWTDGATHPDATVNHCADIELEWTHGDWRITAYTQPAGIPWDGPSLDDSAGFVPWPGGQLTFVTG